MLWKRGALKQKCTENSSQNPWKILMRKFIFKFTGDGPLLKINTFTKIFEEAWPQFQLTTFLKIYCIEQLILHSSSGCDFWKSIRIIKFYVFNKIFYNESISSFLPGYSFVPTAEQLCKILPWYIRTNCVWFLKVTSPTKLFFVIKQHLMCN